MAKNVAQAKPEGGKFRDRVVGLHRVKASELRANPKNWRLHPEGQKEAMKAVLERIGIAGALIARKTETGLELLNGHLRQELLDDELVPVLEVDLNDKEAAEFLATYDPLGAMAIADEDKLRSLLKEVDFSDHAALRKLAADLVEEESKVADELDGSEASRAEVAGMELQPHEHYDYLVVLASTTQEWNVLCERLGLQVKKTYKGGMGTSRAVRAAKVLALLPKATAGA